MTPINAQTIYDWQTNKQDFVLVDTLPVSAYDKAHLPGAIHIVSDNILKLAPSYIPDKKSIIVVYCASATCKRAGLSAKRLKSLGYVRVYHFVGGKREWLEAGLSLESRDKLNAG